MNLSTDTHDGAYKESGTADRLERYTCYTKDSDGEWSEEIDVDAYNRAHAKKVAEAAIVADYDARAGLKVAEVVHRPKGFLYC